MKELMIVLGILAFLIVMAAVIKVGVEIYLGEKNRICINIGPLHFDSDKMSKLKNNKSKKKKPKEKKKKEKTAVNKLYIIKTAFTLVSKLMYVLRRHLVFRMLKCHIGVATDDAAKTAMAYGGISAAVNILCGTICNNFTVKKRDINVFADFNSQKISYDIFIKMNITLLDGVLIGVIVGIAVLKAVYNIKKQNKAV